ncbi:MAG: hypothetical protein JO208_13835 [Alphaproteobacteria bacterium]|nr:hypothetical protein [Alphaproteobacteria bacterium]
MRFEGFANPVTLAAALVFASGVTGGARAALTVSTGATNNVSCSKKHVCTATAADAVLNVTDLANMLASGDVRLVPGSLASDIDIAASLSWASNSRLTLDAHDSIMVEQSVTITGTGAMTFTTNDGGSGGVLTFGASGYVNFWDLNSGLIINKKSFTLIDDIASLASGIAANPKGNFALSKSYDATPDGTYTQAPIPTVYKGALDGLGNTISHLSIDSSGHQHYLGLFAKVLQPGTIGNMRLTGVKVTGNASYMGMLVAAGSASLFDNSVAGTLMEKSLDNTYVGGMAGQASGAAFIIDNHANVSVTSKGSGGIGGLIGDVSAATISNDASEGSVTVVGGGNIGGLFGGASSSGITGCHSSTTVVAGTLPKAGGLIGETDYASISDSYATGSVTAAYPTSDGGIGGLVAFSRNTTISGSYATGNVQSTNDVVNSNGQTLGGLVGTLDGGSIVDSHATGGVIAPNNNSNNAEIIAGGLVGDAAGVPIARSFATGNVTAGTGSDVSVGGLVGDEGGPIDQSWASGSVSAGGGSGAGATIGGLAGAASPITNSYATGHVSCGPSSCSVGGLGGGADRSALSQVYSTGSVSGGAGSYVGGVIGFDNASSGSATAGYWDLDTSGVSEGAGNVANDPGLTGLSDAQLKSGLPSGFDPNIWGQSAGINNGYPYLLALPPGSTAVHGASPGKAPSPLLRR